MTSFYLYIYDFLYIVTTFCGDTGLLSPYRRRLTLYLQGMASGCPPLFFIYFSLTLSRAISSAHVFNPCAKGAVTYNFTLDYPIHTGTSCPTQNPFSANYIK